MVVVANNTGSRHFFDYSEELFELMDGKSWFDDKGYLRNDSKVWGMMYAHWLVNGKPKRGYQTDHIDHNIRNNRGNNLRTVTASQNQKNKRGKFGRVKGAYYDKRDDVWTSSITVDGLKIHLGTFKSAEEAGRAYDKAAERYHGIHSLTNERMGLL